VDDADFLAGRFGDALRGGRHGERAVPEQVLLRPRRRQQPAGQGMIAFNAEIGRHACLSLLVACVDLFTAS